MSNYFLFYADQLYAEYDFLADLLKVVYDLPDGTYAYSKASNIWWRMESCTPSSINNKDVPDVLKAQLLILT